MKNIYKIFVLFIVMSGLSSCDPNENFEILPAVESFQITTPTSGSVVVLDDTNLTNTALFISWSVLKGNEGSTYNIEIVETGTDFANPILLGTSDGANFSMTVEELNTFFLDTMGIDPDKASSMDIRVLNNGETTQTIAVVFTPYTVEYTELFLVGSLTNWEPTEALVMTRLDFNLFEIIIDLADGDEFKFIPTNINWDGDFGEDLDNPGTLINKGSNLKGYAAGKYTITVDLNTFTFTLKEIVAPENLYLVGDATAAGWSENNNNYPMFKDPDQDGIFIYTGYFDEGSVKLLEAKGSWQPQWGKGANDGELAGNPSTQTNDPDAISVSDAGYYTLKIDFNTLSYTLEPFDASTSPTYSTIGVIGAATPTGWGSDTDMTQSSFDPHIWYMTLELNENDGGDCDCGFKFRADNDWAVAWGGIVNPPTLNYGIATADGGKNIGVPETGTYTIFFNTLDLRYYYIIE